MQTSISAFVKRQRAAAPAASVGDVRLLKCESSTLLREREFGERVGVVLGAMYRVPCGSLLPEELEQHKEKLTMHPIEFANFSKSSSFAAFECDGDWLGVPRFYGVRHFGPPKILATAPGEPVQFTFAGNLGEAQLKAAQSCLDTLRRPAHESGGMLVLPCGYGKTIVALYVAATLGVRTCVLVHKSFLTEQWRDRVHTFLPGATVGRIQGNTMDAEVDVCIAMVQSVAARDYPASVLDKFGLLIVDEAHHMSAPYFSRSLRKLKCARILALSATPERKDGLTDLLYWSMGPVLHRVQRRPEPLDVFLLTYNGGKRRELQTRDGNLNVPRMITDIAGDASRNRLIAKVMAQLHARGRNIIVLSDRITQLKELLVLFGAEAGPHASEGATFYIGSTSASEREAACERSPIFSTFSMAKEGLDIPRLDTLVFATPKSDIEQSVGRIQRPCDTKQRPLVVDIVDPWSVFRTIRFKRCRHYREMQYVVTEVDESSVFDTPWP